ncbi:acyl-CoA dehydrogenase family protein [Streptomyces sp. MAR4 CNY-716]
MIAGSKDDERLKEGVSLPRPLRRERGGAQRLRPARRRFQAVAKRIVAMKIGLETSRKWLYDTAEKFTAGRKVTADLATAKLVAGRAALDSALGAVQVFGGNGYMAEYGLGQELRSAVAGISCSGTTETQYDRIAATLGLGRAA